MAHSRELELSTAEPLLRERTAHGVASRLDELVRLHMGASESALWIAQDDGSFRATGSGAPVREHCALGSPELPTVLATDVAPAPWRGRFDFGIVSLHSGGTRVAILAIAFARSGASTTVAIESWLTHCLAVAATVLERNLLRDAVSDARNTAVARLGAGLSHTLGNVLQAALSSVESARASLPGDPRPALHDASTALKRAAALVTQMGALGGTRGAPQPTEISALVTGLVAVLVPQMPVGIELRLERVGGEVWSNVDPVGVESALAGLLHQSREQLGAAGCIGVSVDSVIVHGARYVEVEIRHAVVLGRRATESQRAAAPRVPSNDGGDTAGASELGMTMARVTLARHHGTVERRIDADASRTIVWLPVAQAQSRAPDRPSTGALRSIGAALTVLIADDEPAVLRGVQRLLSAAGHTVLLAHDGAEAVAIVGANREIDVVLMDLTMPDLSGPPLVAALRRIAPQAAIVVMTGYASDEMTQALRAEGALLVLQKPIAGARLLEALGRAAQQHAETAGGVDRS